MNLSTISIAVDKFMGAFLPLPNATSPGVIVLALVGAAAFAVRRYLGWHFALLVLAWLATITITAMRVPIDILHPVLAGPRYFFYPYILFAWLCIWIAASSAFPVGLIMVAGYAFALTSVWQGLTRNHDTLDWRANLETCVRSDTYEFPIHVAGKAGETWAIPLTGALCRQMIDRALVR